MYHARQTSVKTMKKLLPFLLVSLSVWILPDLYGQVKIWEDSIVLPTYQPKPPDRNPMFYVPDAYQGAKRVLYPYPLMDNLSSAKSDQAHKAIFLENEYLKLCLLPDIGGRLFYATDKTNDYEIFYRQHVIKPANIGMLGAWISGGIEWCVFHHHRASTYLPVDYRLEEHADGSKTLWFGEFEPRHRMSWSIGLTLRPGRSYLEADVRMFNRTTQTHSILYWANVATHVNDDYQVFFPPSVSVGVYHAKNSFIHWPLSDEIYNGKDYTGGIDVSWWKNHPDPISIFAHDLKEDFMGGYDHARNAGTVHVGNHHVVKGAKLWEWGPGEYGHMWDCEILTDDDGPYAELMVGGFSDNQPDYSWIKPGEVKHLKQYWYPVRDIGGIKKANLEAAVNVQSGEGQVIQIGFNSTRERNDCRLVLEEDGQVLLEAPVDIGPAKPYFNEIRVKDNSDLTRYRVSLLDEEGRELIAYQELKKVYDPELPETIKPPLAPGDYAQIEELVLAGQRILQFHNPGYDPRDYFLEAVRRDPLHSLANLHLGNLADADGDYDKAAAYYRNSIRRLTADYTRPRDGESLYRLGVVLKKHGKYEDATDTLYRASWDQTWYAAAHLELAKISLLKGQADKALDHLNQSLALNALNPLTHALKAAVLRHLGEQQESLAEARQARVLDPLDRMAAYELLLNGNQGREEFLALMNSNRENYLEITTTYLNCGLYSDAAGIVELALASGDPALEDYPILLYYSAFLQEKMGREELAALWYQAAAAAPTDYVFPFRFETLDILDRAIQVNPEDARAWYYKGNILYDHQPVKAMAAWEKAVELDPQLAIAHRNLGWGHYRFLEDLEGAIENYERAMALRQDDPRYYLELDQLYELANASPEKRQELYASHPEVVGQRNDTYIRNIEILLLNARYDEALALLSDHTFLRQEGVVRLHDLFVDAQLLKGRTLLQEGDPGQALEHFLLADTYPANQMIGRISDYRKEAQIYYFTGLAYQELKKARLAREFFGKVADRELGETEYLYYQSLAQKALGLDSEAGQSAQKLLQSGNQALENATEVDFFAKFGERSSPAERRAMAYYKMALASSASGESARAREYFRETLQLKNSNLWARAYAEKE